MSRQLVSLLLLLQFNACFASRGLLFFHENLHKEELLGSKEEKANSHMQGLTLKCRLKMENCMEEKEGTKGGFEGEAKSVKTITVSGIDAKFEKQKMRTLKMAMCHALIGSSSMQLSIHGLQIMLLLASDVKMVKVRANLESSSTSHGYNEANESVKNEEPKEDIDVKDYAQPQRKPPIHNERT